jgi:pyruvate/2-oxoacid:ferredoxin oxidoreductase alpha subunit
MRKVMIGNHAISWGATVSDVDVIAAYPITPQTQVVNSGCGALI